MSLFIIKGDECMCEVPDSNPELISIRTVSIKMRPKKILLKTITIKTIYIQFLQSVANHHSGQITFDIFNSC